MNKKILKSDYSYDEIFMRQVYLASSKSKDPRTKIGAILVRDNIVVSAGFNGFSRGVMDYESRYTDKETKYNFIVHAEINSILNAARHGISTFGTDCLTNGYPCCFCAKAIIQAGVKSVTIHRQWPAMNQYWLESIKTTKIMFKEAGVKVRIFDKQLNILSLNDGKVVAV